jgi:hypothetical protein
LWRRACPRAVTADRDTEHLHVPTADQRADRLVVVAAAVVSFTAMAQLDATQTRPALSHVA